jgi:hypothetical protein
MDSQGLTQAMVFSPMRAKWKLVFFPFWLHVDFLSALMVLPAFFII